MIDNLQLHDEWKKYPVIICECTEFPDFHSVDSKKHHTHLTKLEPIMHDYNSKQWILIHSSSAVQDKTLKYHQDRLRNANLDVTFV